MSAAYDVFRQSMLARKQVVFTYQGHVRETSPHALGWKNGREKVLFYKFAGGSNSGLPVQGQWRCIFISEISNVVSRDGVWHTGARHSQSQTCVDQIDLEIWTDDITNVPYVRKA